MNPITITTYGVQWRDQLQKSYFSRGLHYTKIQSTDDLVFFVFLYGLRCRPLHQPQSSGQDNWYEHIRWVARTM